MICTLYGKRRGTQSAAAQEEATYATQDPMEARMDDGPWMGIGLFALCRPRTRFRRGPKGSVALQQWTACLLPPTPELPRRYCA